MIGTQKAWSHILASISKPDTTALEKIKVIRNGLPIEAISFLADMYALPVKEFLPIFELPQTTYNKRLREKEVLGGRETELVLLLQDLYMTGLDVFNQEEGKFRDWLKKPILALGGVTPISLFDSVTGIQEVKHCLHRIEYGIFA